MKKKTTVSVIITCYNYAGYIQQAIESVLNQTYKEIEFIIINDGSTDNSQEIIDSYKGKAKIVSRKNMGIVYTRNEAIKIAKGEYICFLDADDYFNKYYIEKMVDVAEKCNADVVYPNWHVFGDENYTTNYSKFDVQLLIRQEIHCTSESLIRKAAIGSHKFENETVAEDWDFFLGLALSGRKFKLAKDSFINYRVHKGTRGSSRPYWDDMYTFCSILSKWGKKYPNIVNPVDFPIHAGKVQESQILNLKDIINSKDTDINDMNLLITKVQRLNVDIANSWSYRVGHVITEPLRLLRTIIAKKR